MDVETVTRHLIYEVVHGSHAYGMATSASDVDRKGICLLPDARYWFGLAEFEQQDSGWAEDKVVYHLPKFMRLASACNPGIIELLYVDERDVLLATEAGTKLREKRGLFLSRRARHTFTGYAAAQLTRILAHKRWLDAPPTKPDRAAFVHEKKVTVGPLGTHVPAGATVKKIAPAGEAGWFELDLEVFDKSGYEHAKKEWEHYTSWRTSRNEKRAALEAKHGFDTKHAAHLVRLLRMGLEILTEGKVLVRRPDADELLAIRNGAWTYERLIAYSDELDRKIADAEPRSPLPPEPDAGAIEELQIDLVRTALRAAGVIG